MIEVLFVDVIEVWIDPKVEPKRANIEVWIDPKVDSAGQAELCQLLSDFGRHF